MKKTNTKKGFTIIELVIVIAVIGILAAVLIPTFSGVIEKANESAAMQAARNEYEVYLSEHAAELTGKENFVIVTGDYQFKVVDALITNFHLPKSTLIMLISAFAGYENTMNLYEFAVENQYRFFSFGDSMFIE